jgi:hypothetical protein
VGSNPTSLGLGGGHATPVVKYIINCSINKTKNQSEKNRNCTMMSFIIFTHPQISLGRLNQGKWVNRARSIHGTREKIVQGFGGKVGRKETTRKTEA